MAQRELEELIKERIRREGPITFSRFMEMALYHVPGGYYTSRRQRVGPEGDFYTSPLAHPAFAALIAIQLEQMWEELESPSPFFAVEIGSGKGTLARDIIVYNHNLSPAFAKALRYVSVERGQPGWPSGWDAMAAVGLPLRRLQGCILSNELLDAMPVHRVVGQGGALREIYVGLEDGDFAETIDGPSTPRLQQRLDSLGVSLGEGQEAEVNLLLEDWVANVATSLDRGYVITIDY
ncbi:MAG: SAM-dependent methyltransferase, partial [Dehalococcoidia bacterium]